LRCHADLPTSGIDAQVGLARKASAAWLGNRSGGLDHDCSQRPADQLQEVIEGRSLMLETLEDRVVLTTISLDFHSLPSAQGWVYRTLGNNIPESRVISVSRGVLYQNSLGVGYASSGNNRYE
jgi:hypothetical protein